MYHLLNYIYPRWDMNYVLLMYVCLRVHMMRKVKRVYLSIDAQLVKVWSNEDKDVCLVISRMMSQLMDQNFKLWYVVMYLLKILEVLMICLHLIILLSCIFPYLFFRHFDQIIYVANFFLMIYKLKFSFDSFNWVSICMLSLERTDLIL